MNPLSLLCDEMLQRLGHWLRAAGHDVVIARNGVDDRSIYRQAIREHRLLVTRDRKIVEYRDSEKHVILLRSNETLALIEELSERLSIDWLYAPFTRCLECNTLLVEATISERHLLPDNHHLAIPLEDYRYCLDCRRIFWEGGHVRRMRETLNGFARGEWRFCR